MRGPHDSLRANIEMSLIFDKFKDFHVTTDNILMPHKLPFLVIKILTIFKLSDL